MNKPEGKETTICHYLVKRSKIQLRERGKAQVPGELLTEMLNKRKIISCKLEYL